MAERSLVNFSSSINASRFRQFCQQHNGSYKGHPVLTVRAHEVLLDPTARPVTTLTDPNKRSLGEVAISFIINPHRILLHTLHDLEYEAGELKQDFIRNRRILKFVLLDLANHDHLGCFEKCDNCLLRNGFAHAVTNHNHIGFG